MLSDLEQNKEVISSKDLKENGMPQPNNVIDFAPRFMKSKKAKFNQLVYEAVRMYKFDNDEGKLYTTLVEDLEFPGKQVEKLIKGGYFDQQPIHEMSEIFVDEGK